MLVPGVAVVLTAELTAQLATDTGRPRKNFIPL